MAGGWTLSIPSTSEHPEEAWEFLKIMLSEDVMGAAQVKFGYLPVRKSFAANLASDFAEVWNEGDDSRWAALDALADKSYGRPAFPSWPAVGAAITDMVQNVMFKRHVTRGRRRQCTVGGARRHSWLAIRHDRKP